MRFEIGDEIDQQLAQTMVHEYYRCRVALESFANYAPQNDIQMHSNLLSIKSYNAYAMFVQHLYEFAIACMKRAFRNTDNLKPFDADAIINREVNKALKNWISRIDDQNAPSWANERSFYDVECPAEFGKNLRVMRNSLSHVDYRRVKGGAEHNKRITLSEFFIQYHKFAILLYEWIGGLWSLDTNEDLGDITNFNRAIFNSFRQNQ